MYSKSELDHAFTSAGRMRSRVAFSRVPRTRASIFRRVSHFSSCLLKENTQRTTPTARSAALIRSCGSSVGLPLQNLLRNAAGGFGDRRGVVRTFANVCAPAKAPGILPKGHGERTRVAFGLLLRQRTRVGNLCHGEEHH